MQFLIYTDGGKVVMRPHNQDDPYRRKPNIARAQQTLHWNPVVSEWVAGTVEPRTSIIQTPWGRPDN